jgi:hypothetical protein
LAGKADDSGKHDGDAPAVRPRLAVQAVGPDRRNQVRPEGKSSGGGRREHRDKESRQSR